MTYATYDYDLNLPRRQCASGERHPAHAWDSTTTTWCPGRKRADSQAPHEPPPATSSRCVWVRVGQQACDRSLSHTIACSECLAEWGGA